ncbi:MAG: hypothetical protein KF744_08185 [Taibaiella sp.]|nr:hypothetical protein [Taibaiella sp.]
MRHAFFLLTLSCGLLACMGRYGPKEVTYLPKGYIGAAVVLLDQAEGREKEYANGYRVYRIPPCGVLRTRFRYPGEVFYRIPDIESDVMFVYVDSVGNVTDTIRQIPHFHDWTDNQIDSFYRVNGDGLFITSSGNIGLHFYESIHYEHVYYLFIDTLKNHRKYRISNLDYEFVEACR